MNWQLIFVIKVAAKCLMNDLQMLDVVVRRGEGLNISQGIASDSCMATLTIRNTLSRQGLNEGIKLENMKYNAHKNLRKVAL